MRAFHYLQIFQIITLGIVVVLLATMPLPGQQPKRRSVDLGSVRITEVGIDIYRNEHWYFVAFDDILAVSKTPRTKERRDR